MGFQRLFDTLRFNANVPLGCRRRRVLQKPLNQSNVFAVLIIDTGGKEFAKGVGADVFIPRPQIVAHHGQVVLDRPLGDREDHIIGPNLVFDAVALQIGVEFHRDGKGPFLFGLLLNEVQPIPSAIPDDVAEGQLTGDVGDPHTQVCLHYQRSRDSRIGPVIQKSFLDRLDDLDILLGGERHRPFVHSVTS